MKYLNAADVLPEELLAQVSKYAGGKVLYVPVMNEKCPWGEKSGSRQYFQERNKKIAESFRQGKTIKELSLEYCLACETIRRIVK